MLKKRVDDIFNRLDMNEFRDRRCDKLSTGMMQKTSIARTLVHDPPVMIFDEPTNGLDIMTARTITAFIRECRNIGKTVIFSTHNIAEAERYGIAREIREYERMTTTTAAAPSAAAA